MRKLCGVHRPTEEVALPFRAALDLKECELLLRFDALGNHAQVQILAQVNNGTDDCGVVSIAGDALDERAIYFQDINGKFLKIAKARVAGAEVIHCQVQTHRFELPQYRDRDFGLGHKDALGEFEVKITGFQTRFSESALNPDDKSRGAEFGGGNIDGNPLERYTGLLPFACLPACFVHYPTVDLDN